MFIPHWLFSSPLLGGHPYLDPGSGSFILQLLIAGLVGAGFIIKAYWKKIINFFKRTPPEAPEQKPDDDTTPQP
ncbi:MAG TPA: hypothetical protein PKM21_16635 [Anaerolineales bacterium]|nr:hypothetical protein [Anaerolineales bacterium]